MTEYDEVDFDRMDRGLTVAAYGSAALLAGLMLVLLVAWLGLA